MRGVGVVALVLAVLGVLVVMVAGGVDFFSCVSSGSFDAFVSRFFFSAA